MPYDEREILGAVARGEMTPDEAARLFETGSNETPPPTPPPPPPPPLGGEAVQVRVLATARNGRVLGDPSVSEARAEGPNLAHREGGTLVIEGTVDPFDEGGFSFEARRPWHWQSAIRRIAEPLVVRVNPATPVDIEARAGTVRLSGRIESGDSRVRCEAGSVNVRLARGSNVRVTARADLGRVRVDGASSHDRLMGLHREVTVGEGAATLTVEAAMGTVDIQSEDPYATPA